MKKELYDFLNTDLQFIKGVGPVLAGRFDEILGGRTVRDFLLHKPSYVRSREMIDSVEKSEPGDIVTVPVLIKAHKQGGVFGKGRRRPTQIQSADKMGRSITIQFFNINFLDYWLEKLPIGQWRVVSGKLEQNSNGSFFISHPEFIEKMENADKIPAIQAIYPAGEGVSQKSFANVRDQLFAALDRVIGDDETPDVRQFFDAIKTVHFPSSGDDLLPNSRAMQVLAYSELYAHQAAIAISRRQRIEQRNLRPVRAKKYDLLPKFYATLPFALTGAQERVIDEIFTDMQKPLPMMRLVQGDVGSGKTIVALAAATYMAESGAQTVLLAPTDTLAQQHYGKLKTVCDQLGIHCDILTGRDKGAGRKEKLISLKSGRTKLTVGTHALFSSDVEYKDLGLVIIDEQHRFGVAQREAMRSCGVNPDMLALSATPIPRTLSMTIYGDMDISIVNEKPAGRLPIKTTKLATARVNELVARLAPQIANDAKVFWVCPLVEESETSDMTAAEGRHDYLKKYFPNTGLVHGKMDKKKRDQVMADFANPNSKMRVLVSTTVIEVGIDVPQATIIVIENAERFGLAALHQLRGRVGRGSQQSFCILMFGPNVTEDGLKRLDVLCETDDGFVIAEQDLMMRGVGELLGTKQSGWIAYNFVDYREHRDLFKLASRDAQEMSQSDQWTKDLMFIFNRQLTVKA